MRAVLVVQVMIHQVIGVSRVRHRVMSAARTVHMPGIMPRTLVRRRTTVRIADSGRKFVAIRMAVVHVVHVAVVQIIGMVLVLYGCMATGRAMFVRVSRVCCAWHIRMIGLIHARVCDADNIRMPPRKGSMRWAQH